MKRDCLHCGNEFEAKRSTARFCSDKCRVYHNREYVATVAPSDHRKEIIPQVAESPSEERVPEIASQEFFLGILVPAGLTGWDKTVWKAEQRDKRK